jgi:hypothetical protein
MFDVVLFDRANSIYSPPPGLRLTPGRMGGIAQGGFDAAEITVDGPGMLLRDVRRWLRYRVQIVGMAGVVWDGYIDEISLTMGGATVTVTTERMFNAVKVLYSYTADDGGGESGETDCPQANKNTTNSEFLISVSILSKLLHACRRTHVMGEDKFSTFIGRGKQDGRGTQPSEKKQPRPAVASKKTPERQYREKPHGPVGKRLMIAERLPSRRHVRRRLPRQQPQPRRDPGRRRPQPK